MVHQSNDMAFTMPICHPLIAPHGSDAINRPNELKLEMQYPKWDYYQSLRVLLADDS